MADIETEIDVAAESGCLMLSHLQLTVVPPRIFDVTTLARLDLGHNEILELPPGIGKLVRLEELWLNNNPLATLPADIQSCIMLKSLYLADTELTTLPRELGAMSSLVEVNVTNCARLKPALAAEYDANGTLGLLALLRHKATRKELKAALHDRLMYDVYSDEGASIAGRERLFDAAREVMRLFPDTVSARSLIRNAARLFPDKPGDISPASVRMRYEALARDNTRKQLAAEVELKLRAAYYDRIDDVASVEGTVKAIMACLPSLEDVTFLLAHAAELLPREYGDVDGPSLYASAQALRARLAEERAAAVAALGAAMGARFADREPAAIALMAAAIADRLDTASNIRSLAAEAAEVFPADFAAVKVSSVVAAFRELQKEKGMAS